MSATPLGSNVRLGGYAPEMCAHVGSRTELDFPRVVRHPSYQSLGSGPCEGIPNQSEVQSQPGAPRAPGEAPKLARWSACPKRCMNLPEDSVVTRACHSGASHQTSMVVGGVCRWSWVAIHRTPPTAICFEWLVQVSRARGAALPRDTEKNPLGLAGHLGQFFDGLRIQASLGQVCLGVHRASQVWDMSHQWPIRSRCECKAQAIYLHATLGHRSCSASGNSTPPGFHRPPGPAPCPSG